MIGPHEQNASKTLYSVKKQRNYCLLLFETIGSIFIVFIHIAFPGQLGDIIKYFARFGVPLFYVVAGYYLIQPNTDKIALRAKLKKRIIHIAMLALFSEAFYFAINLCINQHQVSTYLSSTFTLRNFLNCVLLNVPLFSYPNWFLLAMLYSYIFMYLFSGLFLNKNRWIIAFTLISIVAIILNLIFRPTDITILGNKITDYIYGNWLFTGLPFICFGILLKKRNQFFIKFKIPFIVLTLFIFGILMTVELFLYRHYLGIYIEFGFFNILFVATIVALSIKVPMLCHKIWLFNLKGNWTAYLYILHPAFISFIIIAFYNVASNYSTLFSYLEPIMVLILSMTSAIILNWLIVFVKEKHAHKLNSENQ